MAEINFFEDLNQFIIGLELDESVATELTLFAKNMISSSDVFKIKAKALIDDLKTRNVSEEEIINILLDDFDNDGELFGGLKRGLKKNSTSMLQNIDNSATQQAWLEEGFDEPETWVAVLVATCQDCFPRHGVTLPHSVWIQRGLPASGFSVCKQNCQCQLFPRSVVDSKSELQEPLKRVRGPIREIARKKKKEGRIKNINKYVKRKLGSINDTKDPIRPQYRKNLPGFKR